MHKVLILPLILVGAGAALSGCVTSNADGIKQINDHAFAVSGERTEVGRDWSLNPDCSVRGNPSVRVLQAPKHGKLLIQREDVFPYWKNGKCNSKKVPGNGQYYTSDSGFIGTDRAITRHSYANGFVQDVTTEINVVK
ncbi:hypothetical protein [Rhizobium sp. P28RR-XV]|uniref:hypothetical protein n=1 Tax=Rhizobium sp. P28RR-XV TaxID=2726737 RepID=UPI0014567100|nr:hypothetical protein [Rhizobium sp. P28RR-XV]NLR88808.1 hypothetical protein [Rhizobium sp. P28RR-XV]